MVQDNDEEGRFFSAWDGNNLVTPFQCDHCHFMNLMEREPLENLASDVRLAFGGLTLMHFGLENRELCGESWEKLRGGSLLLLP